MTADRDLRHVVLGARPDQFAVAHVESESAGGHRLLDDWAPAVDSQLVIIS